MVFDMKALYLLAMCICPGETYTEAVKIDGIGQVALPSGEWELEITRVSDDPMHAHDIHVFKRLGERLERMTLQRFSGNLVHPIGAYFDSIGDSTSEGVPTSMNDFKSAHGSVYILRGMEELSRTEGGITCFGASYVYTSESSDAHWMSHAFVCENEGEVIVCVHSSPFAITPETVQAVYDDSEFRTGER